MELRGIEWRSARPIFAPRRTREEDNTELIRPEDDGLSAIRWS